MMMTTTMMEKTSQTLTSHNGRIVRADKLVMFPVNRKISVNWFAINRSETNKMAANWLTSDLPRIVQNSKSRFISNH